jgi:hypothetical protein
MWLQRYYLVRRLLYMGYNTLMLDADCILFHDPYPFFKGPFANYSLISLADSSAGFAHPKQRLGLGVGLA